MIELLEKPMPNWMQPALLDYGFVQRGSSSIRVNRPGSRYRIEFGFPIMAPDMTRRFVARLQRAKRQGIQLNLPLLIDQGVPGSPVVDGGGQTGSSLAVRGFTSDYIVKEGYWLTLIDVDGTAYLHTIVETTRASDSGAATLQIEPPLRAPFTDGNTVEMLNPFIQGFIDGDEFLWEVRTDKYTELKVAMEEFK